MNNYKITNITNDLNKRDVNFNKLLEISYIDQMERKTFSINPQESMYFSCQGILPISIQKYRMKKFITVEPISDNELKKLKNDEKNNTVNNKKTKTTTTTTTTEKKKKKNYSNKKQTTTTTTTKK